MKGIIEFVKQEWLGVSVVVIGAAVMAFLYWRFLPYG